MSRIRLRYVQAWIDRRDGRVHRYVRRPGFPKVRLPGLPGSAEFMEAYRAALAGAPLAVGAGRNKPGSVSAAIALYYGSLEFHALAHSTKVMRRGIFEKFRARYGDWPLAQLPPKFIAATLTKMKPHAARNWLGAIRALLTFAVEHGLCPQDATQSIKVPRPKSDGYYTWSEADIAQFEAHHPIGTKPRLALALLLYTAQRRSDVIRMGRQHIRNGEATVRQQKTGATLVIPVHPDLHAVLAATPSEHLTFLITERGEPFQSGANLLPRVVRRSRPREALHGARLAQGRMSAARRSRLLGQ
jgi:integrase